MKKMAAIFSYALLAFFAGCMFGDSVAVRTVSLSFPVSGTQNRSTDDPDVREALQIIDSVLASEGFNRDTRPLAIEDRNRGLIAFYGICGVSLINNKLEIGFFERYRRHSSATTRTLSHLLKKKLSDRFGSERVQIET
jgi:hypothetical protein